VAADLDGDLVSAVRRCAISPVRPVRVCASRPRVRCSYDDGSQFGVAVEGCAAESGAGGDIVEGDWFAFGEEGGRKRPQPPDGVDRCITRPGPWRCVRRGVRSGGGGVQLRCPSRGCPSGERRRFPLRPSVCAAPTPAGPLDRGTHPETACESRTSPLGSLSTRAAIHDRGR
jgi:hypothetical protein